MSRRSNPRWLAVSALTVAAACAGVVIVGSPAGDPTHRTAPTTTPPTPPPTTAAPVDPYAVVRPLAWTTCGSYQCAQLDVPLDYANPTGPRINVALERHLATTPAPRVGAVVINPGGPGESGIGNFAKDLSIMPAAVLARFDVVTFDPRGVGQSSPVHCTGDAYSGPQPNPVPASIEDAQPLVTSDRAYANACLATSGALLLAHVGTLDVARDLEVLRRALGEPGLTYLGLSYGTLLGATYAGLFPRQVRAMVLDGVVDPALTTADLANAQAEGFENALRSFFSWCQANPTACQWHPAGDFSVAFRALASSASVGPTAFYTGTFGTLYAQSFWPSLGRALAGLQAGNGAPMLALFKGYERVGDPTFSGDANNAITCLDHPVSRTIADYPALARAAASTAPDFGPLFSWGALSCAVWPVPAAAQRVPGPIRAPGTPPILVVGTTQDPATPYAWARSVAAELDHGVLLTRTGVDHVALFTSSCVRGYDAAYLISLQTPPAGTVCPS